MGLPFIYVDALAAEWKSTNFNPVGVEAFVSLSPNSRITTTAPSRLVLQRIFISLILLNPTHKCRRQELKRYVQGSHTGTQAS